MNSCGTKKPSAKLGFWAFVVAGGMLGVEPAAQGQKPVLLVFYKQPVRFYLDTKKNTYNDPGVVEYVEANFVPILIDVDKQSKLAKRYNVRVYPSHYVKHANRDKVYGPLMGYEPPSLFIKKLKDLLEKI